MDETSSERLPQENKRNQTSVDSILEEAESVAQGVLKSIQKIEGATACKGVQIARLAEWAKKNGHWIDKTITLGEYADRGCSLTILVDYKTSYFCIRLTG